MRVFRLNSTSLEIKADFLTRDYRGNLLFWRKPHWYSRRRCVGIADFQYVAYLLSEEQSSLSAAQIAKELGVKL